MNSCFAFKHTDMPVASVTIDRGLVGRAWDVTGTALRALGLTDRSWDTPGYGQTLPSVGKPAYPSAS